MGVRPGGRGEEGWRHPELTFALFATVSDVFYDSRSKNRLKYDVTVSRKPDQCSMSVNVLLFSQDR